MRGIALMFAVVPLMFACGEEDEDDTSQNAASSTSGGMQAAGGAGSGGSASGGSANGGSANGGSGTNGAGGSICERGCEATLEADCENGPESMEQCVTDCENLGASECGEEYAALQACAQGEIISCQAGIPVVAACSSEQGAFIACINQ